MSNMQLDGKTICITGASGGLGKELALNLAKKQTELILIARRKHELEKLKTQLQLLTTKPVHIFAVDLTVVSERVGLIQSLQAFHIDILINNAGYGIFKPAVDFTPREVEDMFALNVFALIDLTREIAQQMMDRQQGVIVQIASQAGKIATNKSSIYAATKSAVIGYSNALRLELVDTNVHVMTVNPGPIATDFFDKAEPTGQYLKALKNHVLDPASVASQIVSGIEKKKREVNIPWYMNCASQFYVLFPRFGDWLTRTIFNKK